jgi:chemotaxis protein methyltransferase CheR
MTDAVRRLREALARWTGLDCGRGGRQSVLARLLEARAAETGTTPERYLASLRPPDPRQPQGEVQRIVNAITVGYTWFLRDAEVLEQAVAFLAGRPVWPSVWVAGCASGDEAYSLAMLAAAAGRRPRIVGSDVNTQLLEAARAAEYGEWSVRLVPPALRERYLEAASPGHVRVAPAIRAAVRFESHNLVEAPLVPPDTPSAPASGWDLIICRNVLVYFEPDAARRAVARLLEALSDDGLLIVGSGEVAAALAELATSVPFGTRTAYRPRHAPRRPRTRTLPGVVVLPPGAARPPPAPPPPPIPAPPPRPTPPAPAAIDELLAEGARRLESGELEDALARLVAAVELDPLCAEARLLIGIAHHAAGDSAAAYAPLRAALFLAPEMWLSSFYLARVHEALGRPDEARREYRRVVAAAARADDASGRNLGLLKGWMEHAKIYALTRLS